jgi:hypothetical protein
LLAGGKWHSRFGDGSNKRFMVSEEGKQRKKDDLQGINGNGGQQGKQPRIWSKAEELDNVGE